MIIGHTKDGVPLDDLVHRTNRAKKTGRVTIPVTINLEVDWETDDNGNDPKPVLHAGCPCAVIGPCKYVLPEAFVLYNLDAIRAAIDA